MKHFYKNLRAAALLVVAMFVVQASAYDFKEGKLCYKINEDSTTVSVTYEVDVYPRYSELTGDVVIPSAVTHGGVTYPVTKIGDYAFVLCANVTNVLIPSSVKSIGVSAFQQCYGLTKVNIGSSVETIGEGAFYYCLNLTEIFIPESVTKIDDFALNYTALQSVTIPASTTTIGEWVLNNCEYLSKIEVAPGNTVYDSRDNCNALIETASNTLLQGSNNTIIPSTVTTIYEDAFDECRGLKSLTIPASVTSIPMGAFENCVALESIVVDEANPVYDSRNDCNAIVVTATNVLLQGCKTTVVPGTVTGIESYAFSGCTGLENLTIPASVSNIRSFAFWNCTGLKTVTTLRLIPIIVLRNVWHGVNDLSQVRLKVPAANVEGYCSMPVWSEFDVVAIGDVDGSGVVNGSDVTALYNKLLDDVQPGGDADVDCNGVVNGADVTALYNALLNDIPVIEPTFNTDISGIYTTQAGTKLNGSQIVPLEGYMVNIYKAAPGVFYIDELLAGSWSQRKNYGSDYAMHAYLHFSAENKLYPQDAIVPGWGDSYDSISDIVYNPATQELSYTIVYAGYEIIVILKRN